MNTNFKQSSAYELAKEIDWLNDYCYVQKAANILRQQADRVAELEKDNKELHAIAQRMAMAESDARKSLQLYKDAEASEPVAWISIQEGVFSPSFKYLISETPKVGFIPVYTTPQTKPLSDDEIEEVIRKHWNKEYGNRNMLTLCKAVLAEANK